MKQIILSLALAIACFGFAKADVEVNSTNFPDKEFRIWIKNHIPAAKDGILTDQEIAQITNLDLSNASSILALNGIRKFTNLKKIDLSYCTGFSSFPLLPPSIEYIKCSHMPAVGDIEFSKYPNLNTLIADNCELTELEVKGCPTLRNLNLDKNHLLELDLSEYVSVRDELNLFGKQHVTFPVKYAYPNGKRYFQIKLPKGFHGEKVKYVIGCGYWPNPNAGPIQTHAYIKQELDEEGELGWYFYSNLMYNGGDTTVGLFPEEDRYPFVYEYDVSVYPDHPEWNGKRMTVCVHCTAPSGVEDVSTSKVVSGVRYYDLQGHESAEPFNGFNIEVTHYTDGTSQSKKFIR